MAEGTSQIDKPEEAEKSNDLECPVCLQKCIHPAQLPCGHVFCFLCVKGIANRSKRCAMCRQEIPADFIEQPKLLLQPETTELFDGGYQWFYEGRNGWWQYDQHTSEDLEQAYKLALNTFETLICAETYVIDFQENCQYPKCNPSRKRSIKRDLISNVQLNIKGVAGWWQYDERTSLELEACYKSGERTCELLIAGFLYIADLETMIQMRRNDHSRNRRIKRDLASAPKKGVAGLRNSEADYNTSPQLEDREYQQVQMPTEVGIPITPSNTPQTPASESESPQYGDLEITIERIRSLWLERTDSASENSTDANVDE